MVRGKRGNLRDRFVCHPGDGTLLNSYGGAQPEAIYVDPVWWQIFKILTLFDGSFSKFWPCLMAIFQNFDPVWGIYFQNLTLFEGNSFKFRPCCVKNPFLTTTIGFALMICRALTHHPLLDGNMKVFWPCLMEKMDNADPVWWQNCKIQTLFDGEIISFRPCLMAKTVKKGPCFSRA